MPPLTRIEEEQIRFGRMMAAREAAAAAAPEPEEPEYGSPIALPPSATTNRPPVVVLLEAAARSLAHFQIAEHKVDDQVRIASLLRDAENISAPVIARAINHVRCKWLTYDVATILKNHKNIDTANLVRGIELVAWSLAVDTDAA
jgi:hypothetical protein